MNIERNRTHTLKVPAYMVWHYNWHGNISLNRRQAFSTFLECSQMSGVFYHSVTHGLGFFICFLISILSGQNSKTHFFYVLYSDKTWVFDQSELAQGPIYVIKIVRK